jgi:hypothetical protein
MTVHHRHYVVSSAPDRIESDWWNEDGTALVHYRNVPDAEEAIQSGLHGELGTRYVLAVDVSVTAVWDRPWSLVSKAVEGPAD